MIQVGQVAPDFTLPNQRGELITLSAFKGQKVVLSWHPFAFTSVCTDQMRALETHAGELAEKNAVAFGLSIDHVPAKQLWSVMLAINETSLLSDFHPFAAVTRAYDVFNDELGSSGRSVVIVNEEGVVSWAKDYPLGELPNIDEIIAAL